MKAKRVIGPRFTPDPTKPCFRTAQLLGLGSHEEYPGDDSAAAFRAAVEQYDEKGDLLPTVKIELEKLRAKNRRKLNRSGSRKRSAVSV